MSTLARSTALIPLLFCLLITAQAQSPPNQTPTTTGSITGRVTINGQPAPGILMVAQPSPNSQRDSIAEAVTDDEGRYQLTGLAAGRYVVLARAPGFALAETNNLYASGPTASVTDGQAVKGIDFALVPGAVITGRVTDAEGKPVIRERVTLFRSDARGQKLLYNNQTLSASMFNTDDRGLYRIYGLPAGSYLVSVGRDDNSTYYGYGYYPRTFYPSVTDEARAKTIDLKPGDEATKIDLIVGQRMQTFFILGHVVDSETGQMITNGRCGFSQVRSSGYFPGEFTSPSTVDARGECGQGGLFPGRYLLTLLPTESGYYGEPITVEVTDHDITNLEIKAHRGGSISGVVTIEGSTNQAALASLPQLYIVLMQQQPGMPYVRLVTPIKADGSFSQNGLIPGKVAQIAVSNNQGDHLLRIERNGVPQPKTFDVALGEQITGLRLVIANNEESMRRAAMRVPPGAVNLFQSEYLGNSSVIGKVMVIGGTLPEGARLRVFAHLVGEAYGSPSDRVIEVSANGNFTWDNLKPGRYEFTLRTWLTTDGNVALLSSAPSQTATVASNAPTQVTLTLDLNAKEEKR